MGQCVSKDKRKDGSELDDESNHEDGPELDEGIDDEGGSDLQAEGDDGSFSMVAENQSHHPLSRLCAYCQYIFDDWDRSCKEASKRFPHYNCYSELQNSAAHGCALCLQFVRGREVKISQEAEYDVQRLEYETVLHSEVNLFATLIGHNTNYEMIMIFELSPATNRKIDVDNARFSKSLDSRVVVTFDDRPWRFGKKLGEKSAWLSERGYADATKRPKYVDWEENDAHLSGARTVASRWLEICRE
ncbi:MAG: hypothetical protein OHK93_007206 [Ramalina farinacea]|uniref:Uncharacterized protein n=1 Tax=Ramalina farinacea TaxID=258253 RepID=A0AA43QK13_9LECA|nr:hypothetical protein [Ramalina farinacea]